MRCLLLEVFLDISKTFMYKLKLRYILGPLLFLIYINELPNDLSSNCKPFSDQFTFRKFGTLTIAFYFKAKRN